jgi:hypothetical protein
MTLEKRRRDKRDLLHSPVTDTLSVKWLVMRPKGRFVSSSYYLVLMIQRAHETNELSLSLASRWDRIPQEVFLQNMEELTMDDIKAYVGDLDDPMPEGDEPDKLWFGRP